MQLRQQKHEIFGDFETLKIKNEQKYIQKYLFKSLKGFF
jgi:hypothetical protein